MSVTVLVPSYNRAHLLGDTLRSLTNQTIPPDEVVVVDDGSTDATAEVVAAFPGIRYLRKENGGKSSAINHALPSITTDYLWIFDDDDVAAPDAVERLCQALDTNAEAGYAFGSLMEYEGGPASTFGRVLGPSTLPANASKTPFIALMEGCYLGGARVMARTDCYREIGGFDERRRRSQDYHVALELARRWPGVQVEGGVLFHYRPHSGVRGAGRHQVNVSEVWRNHHLHDAEIMRELVAELALETYAAGGISNERDEREARLQRVSILLIHRTYPEAQRALEEFLTSQSGASLRSGEKGILDRLVGYTNGLAMGSFTFWQVMAAHAQCPVAKRIRRHLLWLMIRRAVMQSGSLRASLKLIWRSSWFFPAFLAVAQRRSGS